VSGRWQAAVGYALTGEELDLTEPGRPDIDALVEELRTAGWPAERIRRYAVATVEAGRAWPGQIPGPLRVGCGAAQLAAAVGRAREQLGLVALETRPPTGRTRLNADEQRLMREAPPHHVG
jgi:hypothetical protein